MRFPDLFQTFSRRPQPATSAAKGLTATFRNRVLMRCRDAYAEAGSLDVFWDEIHSKLTYLHGSPRLSTVHTSDLRTATGDTLDFLARCSDEHFLDFVEFVFRVDAAFRLRDREALVDDFNVFLSIDDLPYAVTQYVWTKGLITEHGRQYEATTLSKFPQVVRKDSELLHTTAIQPTIQLLADARFTHANAEFLGALNDYRHGKYGDCLTKAGSAFESVLKVICDRRGWAYKKTDTAAPLIKTVVTSSGLEPFLEQPLLLIATIRNRLSTAHGAGTSPREVSRAKAEYVINATASAVLFLVEETN